MSKCGWCDEKPTGKYLDHPICIKCAIGFLNKKGIEVEQLSNQVRNLREWKIVAVRLSVIMEKLK